MYQSPSQSTASQDYKFQTARQNPRCPPGGTSCESAREVEPAWRSVRSSSGYRLWWSRLSSPLTSRPATATMPMKGRFPIRRTLQYLGQGDVVFKESVKVMTVNYNTHGELGEGARSVLAV